MAQDLITDGTRIGVLGPADVLRANRSARSRAGAIGFGRPESEEIALVVTELGSNLIKHAGGGVIKISLLESGERKGIQIESEDSGPGIPDVERALTDGYSTTGTLGNGLGTVNRFMDELEFHPRPEVGMRILCQRWVRPAATKLPTQRLDIGAATRSFRLLPENGDAIVIKQWNDYALVGVIDGLGHGRFAQKAAQTARQYIEQHFDQPLQSLFRGVGRACRATRGVVMALSRFDLEGQTVSIGGVGNVEARLISDEHFHLVVRRGVLGLNAPNPVVTDHAWSAASLLIIHSDGVKGRWQWNDFQELSLSRPAIIAPHLLNKLGIMNDDATIVAVKSLTS